MRPEGVTEGGAHAPLMVQKGLRLLSGYPHIHHLPAHTLDSVAAAAIFGPKSR